MISENLQIDLIRGRFFKLNKERIERTQELMLPTQRDLLELLPLLFHLNNQDLPGYVDEKTPSGVFSYILDDKLFEVAKRQWGGFDSQKTGIWNYDIEAIFLMGSCGTIAFNRKSDFDVWLCHRPELDDDALYQLNKKAMRLEQWFDSIGLEVHFFLMNAFAFKNGDVTTLSSESSGSAQHRILLDEFYRSSIWLAGKTPFWWYVAPEMEASYTKVQAGLTKNKIISEKETIDFGGLAEIPSEEFFGAAVWQIYKGIDSPYKSILKITLMESYAGSYPRNTPLSAEFKQKIYDGIEDPEELDPYLSMLKRIEKHLVNIMESNRLEVIRRSFYLKLNIALSHSHEKNNWRKKLIEKLVASWAWSSADIEHLDNQNNWRLEQVSVERKMLMRNLTKSYSYLSNFARKHAKKRLINQKDLSVLGRKLYSVFERKSGKVEIFNRGIVDSIREESITIMLLHGKDDRDHWRLYRGRVTGSQFKTLKPLKQAYSLIELAAWMHFNQLISDTTQKLLYAPGSDISVNEFNILMDILSTVRTSDNGGLDSETKAFLQTPFVQQSLVFMNIGKPANIVGNRADRQLVSGDVDVLNYGARTECLVQTIEYCYINSWKEIFVFKYYGCDGMAIFICDLLTEYMAAPKQQRNISSEIPKIHCFGSHISHVLTTRFHKLISSVLQSHVSSSNEGRLYIYEAGKKLYCISNDDGKFDFESFENSTLLMDHMSQFTEEFRAVVFDELALKGHALKTVYSRNKKDVVQMFLFATKSHVIIYILDELGVLFYQKMPVDKVEIVAQHFLGFLQTIVEKNRFRQSQVLDSLIESEAVIDDMEVYRLSKDHYHYKAKLMEFPENLVPRSYGVQVIGEVVEKKTVFKFYCDDVEFSTAESGNKIFHVVAEHILKQRRSKEKYYVYITDLELSPALLGKKSPQTVQIVKHLQYKKKIEGKLNKVLTGL